ncbi:DUF4350 domain-containing protein [Halostella salina]|uniref:DUF4350 domain-containing protein n=1 Tax=Halostella salina TaxID=1547897 RepID=UPI000EF7ACC6|nr:DUF4350 domain-containing protein [Halostella salina]
MRSLSALTYPQVLLAALLVATVAGVGVAASTSSAGFGAYNPAWDGASDLRTIADEQGTESQIVRDTAAYDTLGPNETVAVVLSPDEPYDANDTERVRTFVENGGTVVVAADFGANGNDLLAGLGADARVDGAPLRDERHYYRAPALPVATNVSNHSLTSGVRRVTLNHGSAVNASGATVLIASSSYGYLDRNGNDTIDDNETLASYPVATVERAGDGRVIAVSDPSILINAMLERTDNRAFAGNLLGSADTVVLDYSHSEELPPLVALQLTVQRSAVLQVLLGVLGVLGVGAWARRPSVSVPIPIPWSDDSPDNAGPFLSTEEVAETVRRRHPDWQADRVERVTEGIMRRRSERTDDD